jgi:hypothetical protein
MSRRLYWFFCCWLLPAYCAAADNVGAQQTLATPPASHARAVKPLIIPALKAPAKPVAKPAPKSVAKQPVKTSKAPAKPAAKSSQTGHSGPSKQVAHTAKTPATKAKPTRSSAARTKLAPINLNLSLPPELVRDIEFGKPLATVEEVPVLPPMFGEAKPEPSAYQLRGKLINSERQKQDSDNYLDSIDGAQLSIEFRN